MAKAFVRILMCSCAAFCMVSSASASKRLKSWNLGYAAASDRRIPNAGCAHNCKGPLPLRFLLAIHHIGALKLGEGLAMCLSKQRRLTGNADAGSEMGPVNANVQKRMFAAALVRKRTSRRSRCTPEPHGGTSRPNQSMEHSETQSVRNSRLLYQSRTVSCLLSCPLSNQHDHTQLPLQVPKTTYCILHANTRICGHQADYLALGRHACRLRWLPKCGGRLRKGCGQGATTAANQGPADCRLALRIFWPQVCTLTCVCWLAGHFKLRVRLKSKFWTSCGEGAPREMLS